MQFKVTALDAPGTTESTLVSYTTPFGSTDPQTTIDSGPDDPTNSTGASFTFSSSEAGSTYQYQLDADAFASCTSPKSYTGLSAGSHTFEVKATDAAGNTDATPDSHTWTI